MTNSLFKNTQFMEANKTWKLQIFLNKKYSNCLLTLPVTMFKRDVPVAIGPVHQSAKIGE
jgi:hypothetical protein